VTQFSAIATPFTELLLLKRLHSLKQQLTEARVYTVVLRFRALSEVLEEFSVDHRPPLVVLLVDRMRVREVSKCWDKIAKMNSFCSLGKSYWCRCDVCRQRIGPTE
jgi:hypothetical protein